MIIRPTPAQRTLFEHEPIERVVRDVCASLRAITVVSVKLLSFRRGFVDVVGT